MPPPLIAPLASSLNLAISHDIPTPHSPSLVALLAQYTAQDAAFTLALNIKSDGLQDALKATLTAFNITRYFCFDMSVPDMLGYLKSGLKFFTRHSDLEPSPALYSEALGVWLDELRAPWITPDVIKSHQQNAKQICIVSPELHGREYMATWQKYKSLDHAKIMLCTDFPQQANAFFNTKETL